MSFPPSLTAMLVWSSTLGPSVLTGRVIRHANCLCRCCPHVKQKRPISMVRAPRTLHDGQGVSDAAAVLELKLQHSERKKFEARGCDGVTHLPR